MAAFSELEKSYFTHPIRINLMSIGAYRGDGPAEKDALGREQFSRSLAHALVATNSKHGFVIGIEGPWGSGKSSIIEFARGALASDEFNDKHPIVVDFNPWMVSNTGALVEAFLGQIAAAVGFCVNPTKRSIEIAEKLLGYAAMLRHLKALKYLPLTGWIGNAAEGIADAAESVSKSVDSSVELVGDVKKTLPTLDLAARKAELHLALGKLDRTIVVIIDDLDRLPADEIRVVVQAIKAIADFPHTTYLLAYDRDVVAKALGNGEQVAGDAYLEKIVQVAYPIPPVFQSQLRRLLVDRLLELLTDLNTPQRSFELDEFEPAVDVLTKLLRHPRDLTRLLNRLVLSLPATYSETNILDVIVFEALSQRFPAIREKIHKYPIDFVGNGFRGDINDARLTSSPWKLIANANSKWSWEKHLPVGEDERVIAGYACQFLFPVDTDERKERAQDRLRLADRDRLARYLRKSSLEDVPDALTFHAALRDPTALAVQVSAMPEEKLAWQLEWLAYYAPSCSALSTESCIDVLINEANCRTQVSHVSEKTLVDIGLLIERLLRLTELRRRTDLLLRVIVGAPLGISALILFYAGQEWMQWGGKSDKTIPAADRLAENDRDISRARANWNERFEAELQSGKLATQPMLQSVLDAYAAINGDYTRVFQLVDQLTKNQEGLARLFEGFAHLENYDNPDEFANWFFIINKPLELVDRLKTSSLSKKYEFLINALSKNSVVKAVTDRAQENLAIEKRRAEFLTDNGLV